ncbi:GNAT family N-acetyltransferase [Tepidibacter hydrothermalis]|uniref:GNAT family N-acetyltransferase n=1 Tax=Tepidibacter hydrothermalis TaxID=3036126 RepID=A0ABY8EEG9_9FIRM|nr:GNAT family N-acetyltransferase [Tepidibacter hydrothermalis]WFD11331.1 GNAT family N-acetyltransferase [Tepidibacter hydrothermalis]
MEDNIIEIIEYDRKYKDEYIKLNMRWLLEFDLLEEKDEVMIQNVEREILDKNGKVYLLKKDEKIIGTVALKPSSHNTVEILKLAVDSDFKGLGLGSKLMEKAIKESYELGYKNIVLYTNSKLKAAIGLYEKLGFKKIALDDSHYEEVDIKMIYEIKRTKK